MLPIDIVIAIGFNEIVPAYAMTVRHQKDQVPDYRSVLVVSAKRSTLLHLGTSNTGAIRK
jgi:hypothetical protein